MRDPIGFKEYMELIDQLSELADKQELAECAKLLAMNVAHYEMKYGPLPLEDHIAMTYVNTLTDRQKELITRGMETMIGVMASVIQGLEDRPEH